MATIRNAHSVWQGNLFEGSGETTFDYSDIGTYPITWKARTEDARGTTSPEELLAAAHSACFSMAFSNELSAAGFTPERVDATAEVGFDPSIPAVSGSKLIVTAKVPGISEEKFQELAEAAKAGCPVSKALAGVAITLEATLEA